MRYRWIFVGILVAVCVMSARVAWEYLKDDVAVPIRPAVAQEIGSPTEQSDGSLVFSGQLSESNNQGLELVTTEPFELEGGTVTITTSSDPESYEPFVVLQDEEESPLATNDEGGFTEYIYDNVAAGTYTLNIFTGAPPNISGTYTVTVSEGSAVPAPDPPPEETQPENPPQQGGAPRQSQNDDLLRSSGNVNGPLPLMRDGTCPKEFPVKRGQTCNAR